MSDQAIRYVRAEITAWLSDDFPGFVEVVLLDHAKRPIRFVEKAPVVASESLQIGSAFPAPCLLACSVADERLDEFGLACTEIDLGRPWGMAAVDGRTRFLISAGQLVSL